MIQYSLEVAICWSALYLIYICLLKRETFFGMNRGYLMSSLVIGLIIPLVKMIDWSWQDQVVLAQPLAYISTGPAMIAVAIQPSVQVQQAAQWQLIDFVMLVYVLGVLFMAARLAKGIYSIYQLYTKGIKTKTADYTLVQTSEYHLPFSFLRYVFFSEEMQLTEEVDQIMKHELTHIKSRHSYDVFFLELLHILFWWNPLIYLYKKELRQVHEYLADAMVIQDTDKKIYGRILLGQSQSGIEIPLTHQFFHSHLKQRITMMYKQQSKRPALVKYLLALPLIFGMVILFSSHRLSKSIDPILKQKLDDYVHQASKNDPYPSDDIVDVYIMLTESYPDQLEYIQKRLSDHIIDKGMEISFPMNDDDPLVIVSKEENKNEIRLYNLYAGDNNNSEHRLSYQNANKLQTSGSNAHEDMVLPLFPGCEQLVGTLDEKYACANRHFLDYLYQRISYPKEAEEQRIEGIATVEFTINKKGKVADVYIMRDLGGNIGNSIKTVIESMNQEGINWAPAMLNNEVADFVYTLPIHFKMELSDLHKRRILIESAGYGVEDFLVSNNQNEKSGFGITYIENSDGIYVHSVDEDLSADRQGVMPGDKVIQFDYEDVNADSRSIKKLQTISKDAMHTMMIERNGVKLTASLFAIADRSDKFISILSDGNQTEKELNFLESQKSNRLIPARIGIEYWQAFEGVTIKSIDKSSSAYIAGIRKGDVLKSIDDVEIKTTEDLQKFMESMILGNDLKVSYERDGRIQSHMIELNIAGRDGFLKRPEDQIAISLPRFPGCEDQKMSLSEKEDCANDKLLRFLYQNILYAESDREQHLQGLVMADFTIDADGTAQDIEITQDFGGESSQIVKHLIESMNEKNIDWRPAYYNGKPIAMRYTLPVTFALEADSRVDTEKNMNADRKQIKTQYRLLDEIVVVGLPTQKKEESKESDDASGSEINPIYFEIAKLRDQFEGNSPLVVVNDRLYQSEGINFNGSGISMDQVKTIDYIDARSAQLRYGASALHGAIVIQLSDLTQDQLSMLGEPEVVTSFFTDVPMQRSKEQSSKKPLIIINDEIYIQRGDFENFDLDQFLSPDDIEVITVSKDIPDICGFDASNGVVKITTKKRWQRKHKNDYQAFRKICDHVSSEQTIQSAKDPSIGPINGDSGVAFGIGDETVDWYINGTPHGSFPNVNAESYKMKDPNGEIQMLSIKEGQAKYGDQIQNKILDVWYKYPEDEKSDEHAIIISADEIKIFENSLGIDEPDLGDLDSPSFILDQNKPNPVTESTTISFELPQASRASISFFTAAGARIMTHEKDYPKGKHELYLSKAELQSHGVIYYQLEASGLALTKKMIVLE